MNIENQVLSINQVQELQELGFDVKKHSSIEYAPVYDNEFKIVRHYLRVRGTGGSTLVIHPNKEEDVYIPTMSIGDIIEVLPEKIKTYSANADEEINFYPRINNTGIIYITTMIDDCIFCSIEGKLINNLFNCLVWCIKNLK